MAKIKHIAIVTMDPPKLAEFYRDVFDMKILHSSNNGATYLTDGYINLALLPNKAEGKPNGLNHFGFEIDDQAEIAAKMEGARPAPAQPALCRDSRLRSGGQQFRPVCAWLPAGRVRRRSRKGRRRRA